MKIISAALILMASFVNAPAQAGHKEDCDRSEYAQQYAARFIGQLNGALEKVKDQDKHYRAKLDGIKAELIQVNAWTEAEAAAFMIKASVTDEDAKALEAERKKAAGDFKVQLLSLDGIPVITGGDKVAALRATCLLGPAAISKADALLAATEQAWILLESKMAAQTSKKNHAPATLPGSSIKALSKPSAPRPPENGGLATIEEVGPQAPSAIDIVPATLLPLASRDGLSTEKWRGTMACGARLDGMGKKSYEVRFTMERRGSVVTLARNSATAAEVLSGRVEGGALRLTGKGTLVDGSHSWTLHFSGPFSEGVAEWSGTGAMNGGAGVVRQCVLTMRRG